MIPKPSSCVGCVLYGNGKGFSKLRGRGEEHILLVGDALEEEEEIAGSPLVGKTGQFLSRVVARTWDNQNKRVLSLDRDFWISNVVRCRPPQNELVGASYEEAAIERCRTNLEATIRETRPKALLGLGATALRALTGHSGIEALRGYAFPTKWGIPAVATYHPSYLVRGNFELVRVQQVDILKALHIARHGLVKRETKYELFPDALGVQKFVSRYNELLATIPSLLLAFDIETPYGAKDEEVWDVEEEDSSWNILRISFSFEEHTAITMPWMEPYISYAKQLLSSSGPKTTWNGTQFDIPRLEANGVDVKGDHWDAMFAWKCIEPALPMGLKFVATVLCPDVEAWKLLARSEPEYYSAADSDILLRCMNKIKSRMEAEGKWRMFERHFIELSKVLMKMTKRGVKVNREARAAAKEKITSKLETTVKEVQPQIPMDLRPKKIFQIPLETLEKRGYRKEQLMLVPAYVPSIKKGWQLCEEGYLVRIPKPPRVKRVKKTPSSSESPSPSTKKRSRKKSTSSVEGTPHE